MVVRSVYAGTRGDAYQVVENLLTNDTHHFEGLHGGDGVDKDIAMNTDEVFGVQDAVFVLED